MTYDTAGRWIPQMPAHRRYEYALDVHVNDIKPWHRCRMIITLSRGCGCMSQCVRSGNGHIESKNEIMYRERGRMQRCSWMWTKERMNVCTKWSWTRMWLNGMPQLCMMRPWGTLRKKRFPMTRCRRNHASFNIAFILHYAVEVGCWWMRDPGYPHFLMHVLDWIHHFIRISIKSYDLNTIELFMISQMHWCHPL